jgi:hypothetical protein
VAGEINKETGMKFVRATTQAVLACLIPVAVMAQGAAPPAQGKGGVPPVRIQFKTDSFMECHYYLKSFGKGSVKPDPASGVDFTSEATAYSGAIRLANDPAVWRWFEEKVADAKDPESLRLETKELPPAIDNPDVRTGVNMLVDGLASAYPKYMKTVYAKQALAINRTLINARKRFIALDGRVEEALVKQMAFEPFDKPIIIHVVLRTSGVTTWGTSREGYFTVIGVFGQSPLSLLETGIHEATHIMDALQTYSSRSVLRQVRSGVAAADGAKVEVFLHGLVAFNAGELVKRFLSQSYIHAGVRAQAHAEQYRPYMSTYEFIWTDYLNGKMSPDGVSRKLIEEFNAVQKLTQKSP